jgi:hypothetical protein
MLRTLVIRGARYVVTEVTHSLGRTNLTAVSTARRMKKKGPRQ